MNGISMSNKKKLKTLNIEFWVVVTYWPPTQPSIKKQVHPVEDIKDITLTCGRVEISSIVTPTGSRWVSNNYITRCHRQFELVGVQGRQSSVWGSEFQSLLEIRCHSKSQRQTEVITIGELNKTIKQRRTFSSGSFQVLNTGNLIKTVYIYIYIYI